MRKALTRIFWPILRFFETGMEPVNYKASHRVVLQVVGILFLVLSVVSAWAGYTSGAAGSIIPVLVFFGVGLVAVVLGALGSDGAVARMWGNK